MPAGPVAPPQVLREPLILRERGSSTREALTARLRTLGWEVDPVLELASTEAVKEAVAAGLGLAVVSELAVRADLAAGRLAAVAVPELRLERTLHLAWHKGKRLSRAGLAFVRVLRAWGQAGAGIGSLTGAASGVRRI